MTTPQTPDALDPPPPTLSPARRLVFMIALVIGGEAIFGLPFIIPRVFRPTVLDVFGITNTELGGAMAYYGVAAMIAYFFGGPLADRFPARRLLCAALLTTALGGLVHARIPDLDTLRWLYAYWGVTTIMLFWAAMIRATREWGGDDSQGTAFGLLDGGRGLTAALLVSVCAALLATLLPEDPTTATLRERTEALQLVIYIFTAIAAAAAVLTWFAIPELPTDSAAADRFELRHVGRVIKNPAVWLQGVIIITAYVGYKGIDDLGLYARDTFGFDDVEAAAISTLAFWIRPVAAIGAGLIADRLGATRSIVACFALMIVGDLAAALDLIDPGTPWMLYTMVISTATAVYAIRGLYFAIFGQAGVPAALTGTAAGIVSLVGYTPDIFMGPLMGYFTDTFPGPLGHRYLFAALAAFAALGLATTLVFAWYTRRRPAPA